MREYERSGVVTPAYVFDADGVRSRVEKYGRHWVKSGRYVLR